MRIKLEVKKALELADARGKSGLSQYELADELGWPRSKIKRIEKAEVQTIEEGDLKRLEEALDVKDLGRTRVEVTIKKKKRGADVVPLFRRGELFERVQFMPARLTGDNCAYFRVKMAKQVDVDSLMGTPLELAGYSGKVHGVENVGGQDQLRPGEVLVIMLWARNIQNQRPKKGNLLRKKSHAQTEN